MTPALATIIAALVGAGTALITLLIRDIVAPRVFASRDRKRSQTDILRSYLTPLAQAATSLVWRFNELFVQDRRAFLRIETHPPLFNEYKRRSTLYRIAALLGWMKAIELELSSFAQVEADSTRTLLAEFDRVRRALGDGDKTELVRLNIFSDLCGMHLPSDQSERKRLAHQFETELYRRVSAVSDESASAISRMGDRELLLLGGAMVGWLASRLGVSSQSAALSSFDIRRALAYRETLIYREWQAAIAEKLLLPDKESARRYKILGYEDFERLLDDDEAPVWIRVFKQLVEDVDFDHIEIIDARVPQLQGLAQAIAEIALHLRRRNASLIDNNTEVAAIALQKHITSL